MLVAGKKRCATCYQGRYPPKQCGCGAQFASRGTRCPACVIAVVKRAIELHASGMTWTATAEAVGYGSYQGIRDAAKRAGYDPGPRPPEPKPKPQRQCQCGAPIPGGNRGANRDRCDDCVRTLALHAVEMYNAGRTLRQIGDELGYRSKSSVTSLIKTVAAIATRTGRPDRHRTAVLITESRSRTSSGLAAQSLASPPIPLPG